MRNRQFVLEYRSKPLTNYWHKQLIFRIRKCSENILLFPLLLFFIMNCNLTFAQEFRIDFLLLERKIVAKNDSENILLTKKVFVTNSDCRGYYGCNEEYCVKSEYWLFWNNKSDSLQIAISSNVVVENINISFRKLQNKINAVVLEYSEIIDRRHILVSNSNRVFQIINIDTKSILFYKKEQECIALYNGGTFSSDFRNYDTYYQMYSLTFDDNDNVTLIRTHIDSNIRYSVGKRGKKQTKKTIFTPSMPKLFYILTDIEGRLVYLRKYDN